MSVDEAHYAATLFALDSMFVQVYFDNDTRLIDRITFARRSDLDKYLTKIKLG